ncbi:MAG: type II toxin-antitoxin system VapC family toxin [Planctomycetes bacterium]|nr:type II toxin-antitoxin system VapC family toxin [Planctomycetota bacterium]
MILLDTHIFLWLILQSEKIPKSIFAVLKKSDSFGLASVSLWEIAMLHSRQRIIIPGSLISWLNNALNLPKLTLLDLTPDIAVKSASLPMHGDPADRIIAATAIQYDCRLATVDRKLTELPLVKTLEF